MYVLIKSKNVKILKQMTLKSTLNWRLLTHKIKFEKNCDNPCLFLHINSCWYEGKRPSLFITL
jgi:hypothetical protein